MVKGRRLALPAALVVAVYLMLLAGVLGAAARPLGGEDWEAAGGTRLPAGFVVVQTLRRLYLQQLGGPGASCGTNSPNNGCPP